jgi:hypothetical protein
MVSRVKDVPVVVSGGPTGADNKAELVNELPERQVTPLPTVPEFEMVNSILSMAITNEVELTFDIERETVNSSSGSTVALLGDRIRVIPLSARATGIITVISVASIATARKSESMRFIWLVLLP